MKKISLSAFLLIAFFSGYSQGRIFHLGAIPGYVTLTCDLHSHTVFSDGEVWPSFRVREAVNDGLDVLAITDHLEYLPNRKYITGDDNSAFAIGKTVAEKNGLILVRGTEITRRMPPGHFNLLFLPDSVSFPDTTFLAVIKRAVEHGAFIQWNHPGWKAQQPDGIAKMTDIHRELIKRGWLHGVEIFNDVEFYPGVMEWCIDDSLAMTGNTDIHGTTEEILSETGNSHRVMTLVFAREKNEKELKEALFLGRTLVWYGDTLAGKQEYAEPFVSSCLKRSGPLFEDKTFLYYRMENRSDIRYYLIDGINMDAPRTLTLGPQSYRIIRIKKEGDQRLTFTIGNVKTGTGKRLTLDL